MLSISHYTDRFSDWEELLSLLQAAFSYMEERVDPPSSLQTFDVEKLKEKAQRETLILAYDDEQLVGCVFANKLPRSLYIGKLAILPSNQGRGIGQRLVAACSLLAKQKGLKTLQLQTRIELVENQEYFGKLGFIKTAEGSHKGYNRVTEITMQCTVA
ncbi:MAG: GNAT family N-acetyltransferase [Sneathiella sp.]